MTAPAPRRALRTRFGFSERRGGGSVFPEQGAVADDAASRQAHGEGSGEPRERVEDGARQPRVVPADPLGADARGQPGRVVRQQRGRRDVAPFEEARMRATPSAP